MSDEQEFVTYSRDGNVAEIVFNRPEKLNAISDTVGAQLSAAFNRFDLDEEAFVCIISGNGRAFSTGADVQQRQLRPKEEAARLGGLASKEGNISGALTESVNFKPVIAAVHGFALGMALGLALECELVVADETARFQVTEVGRGLGGTRYVALMRYRGAGTFADEVGLTGRFFTGAEAAAAGLINAVVPAGEHLDEARRLAAEIAKNPPLSARATVRLRRWEIDQVKRACNFVMAPLKLHLTEDFHESARAFAEKRPAGPFKGR